MDVFDFGVRPVDRAPAFVGSAEGTAAYVRDYVDSYADIDGYLDLIGRDRIAELSGGATSFLADPYRRWLLPHADALALNAEAGA